MEKIANDTREKELTSIKNIFSIQSPSYLESNMQLYICSILDNLKKSMKIIYTIDDSGNILITKGDSSKNGLYPCIAAHIDTVHSKLPNYEVISYLDAKNKTIIRSTTKTDGKTYYTGGCGDDLGGVWIVLDLLTKLDSLKVALFVSEEVGCIGSSAVDLAFFEDCKFIIEGDRRNAGDIINDGMCSDSFLELLKITGEEFGYIEANGLYTDVTTLCERGVDISCCNLSVGYYEAHTDTEYTVFEELLNARDYILSIIEKSNDDIYVNEYSKYTPMYKYSGNKYGFDDFEDDYPGYEFDDYCDAHKNDEINYVVDIDCTSCNPYIDDHVDIVCDKCYSSLMSRKYSYYCSVCNTHKVKL